MSEEQLVQQTIIVNQPELNRNRTAERKAFFNEEGSPVLVVNAINEDYTYPDLLEGWEVPPNIGMDLPDSTRYFKDASGIVWVDVFAISNEDWVLGVPGTPQFILPEDYRPDKTLMRGAIWTDFASPPESTQIIIFANGAVVVPTWPQRTDLAAKNCTVLSGFSFKPV